TVSRLAGERTLGWSGLGDRDGAQVRSCATAPVHAASFLARGTWRARGVGGAHARDLATDAAPARHHAVLPAAAARPLPAPSVASARGFPEQSRGHRRVVGAS